jgi:hypothetical protein
MKSKIQTQIQNPIFILGFKIQNSVEITFFNFSTHFLYKNLIQLNFEFKNQKKNRILKFGFGFWIFWVWIFWTFGFFLGVGFPIQVKFKNTIFWGSNL